MKRKEIYAAVLACQRTAMEDMAATKLKDDPSTYNYLQGKFTAYTVVLGMLEKEEGCAKEM